MYAISALLEAGLLTKPRGTSIGLDRESVLRFRQDWRLMSDLARELRTSSSRLNAAARQRRLKVRALPVRPGYELGVISRAEVECLLSALATESRTLAAPSRNSVVRDEPRDRLLSAIKSRSPRAACRSAIRPPRRWVALQEFDLRRPIVIAGRQGVAVVVGQI